MDVSEHEMLTIMDREDGAASASLYDFSLVNAWSNHPIADSRPEEYLKLEKIQLPVEMDTAETILSAPVENTVTQNQERKLFNSNSDPYEFDENHPVDTNPFMDGLRKRDEIKEENTPVVAPPPPPPPPPTVNPKPEPVSRPVLSNCQLFSSKDLVASMEDLNQIFAEEDDLVSHLIIKENYCS